MASLNLLFVHEVSYEKKPIFEMHEFPEHLAARGHKVTFLQFDEGFKFWQGNRQPRTKNISGRVLPETAINLVTPHQFGIPGLDRLWATISVWPTLESLLKNEKFDAIVLYAVPTYGHQVIQLAKKYGVPVIFRALDVSHLIRKSLLSPLIKSAEKYVYEHANVLSANNPAMARYCSTLGNRTKGTFTNLPPLDVSHFTPQPRDERLAASLGLAPTDLVITYMGSFFYFSGLDTVIREFAKIAATEPRLKLLLIGGGEQEAELKKLVKEHNLEGRVVFTGFIPYRELPRCLQLSTVAINPMLSRAVSNTAFPHKVLQYMAAEIPVVSTKLEGIFETFGEISGISWEFGPVHVLKRAIELSENPNQAKFNARLQSRKLAELFDIEFAVISFEMVIQAASRDLSI
jgi:glycosyltransferase involved in cell wall biosynthesis